MGPQTPQSILNIYNWQKIYSAQKNRFRFVTVEYIQLCDISGSLTIKDLFSFGIAEYIQCSGLWHKKDLFNCVTAEFIQCVTFQGLGILYNPVYIYRD